MNPLRPLSFLSEIKELIVSRPEIVSQTKQACALLLDFILPFSKRKFLIPISMPLTKKELIRLKSYSDSTHKNHSTKAKAILMANTKHSIFEIVVATGRGTTTIYRWLKQFREQKIDFIVTKVNTTKRELILNERTQRVIEILHSPPSAYSINRTSWTYDTIIQAYKKNMVNSYQEVSCNDS